MKHLTLLISEYILMAILLLFFATFIIFIIFTIKNPETMIAIIKNFEPKPVPTLFNIKGVGVLGDSQSDEYQGDDHRGGIYADKTENWVEILAQKRNLNIGAWSTWPEPRRTGYEYNWARSGATANTLLASGQHTGIAEQIKEGKINVVFIYIGANDFAPYYLEDGYNAIYNGSLTEAQIIQKENRIVSDIETALDVIQKTGEVHIFLSKIPNWEQNPTIQVAFPYPDQRYRVTKVINEVNDKLEKMAQQRNILTLDPNEFIKTIPRNKSNNKVQIKNTTFEWVGLNNDPHEVFLSDGIHPGTVLNGLYANYIIQELNNNTINKIKPLSDDEILQEAGLK